MSERSIAVGFRNRGIGECTKRGTQSEKFHGGTRANRSFPGKEEKTVEVNFLLKREEEEEEGN